MTGSAATTTAKDTSALSAALARVRRRDYDIFREHPANAVFTFLRDFKPLCGAMAGTTPDRLRKRFAKAMRDLEKAMAADAGVRTGCVVPGLQRLGMALRDYGPKAGSTGMPPGTRAGLDTVFTIIADGFARHGHWRGLDAKAEGLPAALAQRIKTYAGDRRKKAVTVKVTETKASHDIAMPEVDTDFLAGFETLEEAEAAAETPVHVFRWGLTLADGGTMAITARLSDSDDVRELADLWSAGAPSGLTIDPDRVTVHFADTCAIAAEAWDGTVAVQPLSRRRFGDNVFVRSQSGTRAGTAAARVVPESEPDAVVVRWQEVARRLGVTTRTVRDSARRAGVVAVKLPGGQRAIGLREQDLKLLLGGRDRVGGS